jgi:hypothetical protein
MTEAEKMAERLESVTLFQSYEYNLALNNEAAALIRRLQAENNRLSGRLCVNCGRTFPASHDRAKAPEDCPSQEACTIDMTLEEAFNHWRQKAHNYRVEKEKLMAINESLSNDNKYLLKINQNLQRELTRLETLHYP